MFFELIGTIVAGVAAGLIIWAVNRTLLKGRLARWLVPVGAGAAMLAAAISLEYGWYARTTATMPGALVVADTVADPALFRPWTYIAPFVTRFVAVDQASVQTHPSQPGQRIVTLVFYGRWTRTAAVPVLFDCVEGRRADIADGVEFAADGAILDADWRPVPGSDRVLATACQVA